MTQVPEDLENALCIPLPVSDLLRAGEARRLTGPGLLWDRVGAVLEVENTGFTADRIAALWQEEARRLLDAIGWAAESSTSLAFEGGIILAVSAPVDQLYSATYVAQTVWHFCAARLLGLVPGDFAGFVVDLLGVMAREADPALVALDRAARAHGLDVLIDDEMVSLGHGVGSVSWPRAALPDPAHVDWSALCNIPVGIITGTNGKTTTTRLAAAMARSGGHVEGLTSTEMVRVGETVLDRGDYSGPGGARLLLRDRRVEVALLEIARGGILRRGLPIHAARAAVVTNVAADHLGEYGVNTLSALARAKFAVRHALAEGGALILNAEDEHVVAEARRIGGESLWFSIDPDRPEIVAAIREGRPCAFVREGWLVLHDGGAIVPLGEVVAVPITMGGTARFNISNALAASLLAFALGITPAAIAAALAGFRNDPAQNPGRCNEFAWNGARVFVDFAHNPHSIAAVTEALAGIPARRRFVMLSHAGDRSDQDIRDLARGALALGPDHIVTAELADYLRGRRPGEVPGLLREACLAAGVPADHIGAAASPGDGAAQILSMLAPGDMALLLVHSDRERIFGMLAG